MHRLDRKLSIAPMMDHTDKHFRYFLRLMSQHVLLYTEMVTTGAILFGDKHQHLAYSEEEHPLALQLGGSDPDALGECSQIAEDYGYDEVNLNVGCPSDRVQNGRFGACLMAEPELVAECVAAMIKAVQIPITIKTRIGIDNRDSYEALTHFIETVHTAGCDTFIIHARKAWLKGLSPKENRTVPPLQYETVYQLKKDYPDIEFVINGGFIQRQEIEQQYKHVDGVMIGRVAYQDPYLLAELEKSLFSPEKPQPTRQEILGKFMDYVKTQVEQGIYLGHMTRHILGLFQGQPGARAFRRVISENAYKPGAGVEVIEKAAARVLAN